MALTVRYFLGTPTVVKHSSMCDTLQPNQRLILSKLVKTMKEDSKVQIFLKKYL